VIKPETSDKMRFLMRLNAEVGTAKNADVKGYYIGGKTGTAEKSDQRPLRQEARAQRLHRDFPGGQSPLSAFDHAGRAANR